MSFILYSLQNKSFILNIDIINARVHFITLFLYLFILNVTVNDTVFN